MRITGGYLRGRTLVSPDGDNIIRPTADKTRLAMFNMLESRGVMRDAHVLDMFCGTGALGLEALSRGAASVTFMDAHKMSLSLAKENANKLGVMTNANFILRDVTTLTPRPTTAPHATLVFMDPPYRKDLVGPTLTALKNGDWLAENATLVVETEKEYANSWPNGFDLDVTKNYGETSVFILTVR